MQLDREPGDRHAVGFIGLVRGVILLLAIWLISGWMHTSGRPRSAHSRCTCSHRGPVGSHATVCPASLRVGA